MKLWTTVNEPNYYCMNFALISLPGSAARRPGDDYKCVHHTNLAHMRVYRLYQDRYRKDQQGAGPANNWPVSALSPPPSLEKRQCW